MRPAPIESGRFSAKTRLRAKPDGLTPVALRAKRPLTAPSRPSSSRLGPLSSVLGAGKWGAGGRTTVRPALAPHLSCKSCVFAVHFSTDTIAVATTIPQNAIENITRIKTRTTSRISYQGRPRVKPTTLQPTTPRRNPRLPLLSQNPKKKSSRQWPEVSCGSFAVPSRTR